MHAMILVKGRGWHWSSALFLPEIKTKKILNIMIPLIMEVYDHYAM